jgi:hypothetical protein
MKISCRIIDGRVKKRDHLQDLDIGGLIVLKHMFKEHVLMIFVGSCDSEYAPVVSSYQQCFQNRRSQ